MNSKLKKTNTLLLAIITVCIVIITVRLLTWSKDDFVNEKDNLEVTEESIDVAQSEESDFVEQVSMTNTYDEMEAKEMFEIENPYCTIQYPIEWQERLITKENTEGEVYSKIFSCMVNEQEVEIFRIYFGEVNFGNYIGSIEKDGVKIPVNITISEFERGENWTEDDFNTICAMQEAINNVIWSVKQNENYVGE